MIDFRRPWADPLLDTSTDIKEQPVSIFSQRIQDQLFYNHRIGRKISYKKSMTFCSRLPETILKGDENGIWKIY